MNEYRQRPGPLPRQRKFSGMLRLLVALLLIAVILVLVLITQGQKLFNRLGNGQTSPVSSLTSTSSTQSPLTPGPGEAKGCEVTKNTNSTYSYSWLHVSSQGDVVDTNDCVVHLFGWNAVGAFLGTGGSIGSASGSSPASPLIHTNVVRVAFNSRWYESDVYVPDQRMHYKAWLQKIVSTFEARGDYVVLDANTAFFDPPCGNDGMGSSVTFCSSEDQGRKDYTNPSSPYYQNQGGLELYQPIALQALTDLAKLYANDPAVIFDVWNEPGDYIFVVPGSVKNRAADMNERINSVRQYDPRALIIVFAAGVNEDLSYKQPNLVFDFHVYPNFSGMSPVTHTYCSTSGPDIDKLQRHLTLLRKAGRAIFIGEWGHCYDIPSYNQQILSIAKTYDAGLAYFYDSELFTKSKGSKYLNANGILVQQDFESIFGHN